MGDTIKANFNVILSVPSGRGYLLRRGTKFFNKSTIYSNKKTLKIMSVFIFYFKFFSKSLFKNASASGVIK